MKSCKRCGFSKIPDNRFQCPSCKFWDWGVTVGPGGNDGSVILEDVKSADYDRIKTGFLDDAFGGGIVRDAIILLGGLPGAGKSTLLLQFCEVFCREGESMYIASEEGLEAIRARADRLGVKTNRKLRFVPAMGGVADIGALLMYHKPAAIILDSLDGLVGQDDAAEIKALEVIKKFAVVLRSPALVISQVNKQGDYSGLMAKQHAVDVLATLSPNEDFKSVNGEAVRCFEVIKNRHGRAFTEHYLEMTERGLRLVQAPEKEDEEETED